MNPFVLEAGDIHKTYYHPIEINLLKGIDLTVSYGESVAIRGRSGEGKSTFLHILGTLEQASQGVIKVAGKDVAQHKKATIRNRHMGFIFQSFHLLEDYTVLENVVMPAQIGRYERSTRSEAFRKGRELLDFVGLSDRTHFITHHLSGGEKQRVAIARALCNDPDILFADEPSGNLDEKNARMIHALLLHYVKEKNKALVVVTHDPQLASLCDTEYHLQNGSLNSRN